MNIISKEREYLTTEKEVIYSKNKQSYQGNYPTYQEYNNLLKAKDPDGKKVSRIVIGDDLHKQVKGKNIFVGFEIKTLIQRQYEVASENNRILYASYYGGFMEIKCLLYKGKSLLLDATISRNDTNTEKYISEYLTVRKVINQYLYLFNLPIDFWVNWENKLPNSKKFLLSLMKLDEQQILEFYQDIRPFAGLEWLESIPEEIE